MVSAAPAAAPSRISRQDPQRRAGEVGVDQHARLRQILLGRRLLAERPVGEKDLVGCAEARRDGDARLSSTFSIAARSIGEDLRGLGAAGDEVGRIRGEPLLQPPREDEARALRGARRA